MIIVDINVFILDKLYDFELNEDAKVREVIEEIVHMVEQKEPHLPEILPIWYLWIILEGIF